MKNLSVLYVVIFMKAKLHLKSVHYVKLLLQNSKKWKKLKAA